MSKTYLDSDGVTSLVQKIRQNFYSEGDAITASTVTVNGTVDANLLMGKIANSSDDTAGSTVGSATQPVYLSSGTITQTGTSLAVDITGNAITATKLATARTIRTNLASTSTASFDGSANITPGVTGILSVANGGTGSSTEKYLPLSGGTISGDLIVSGSISTSDVSGDAIATDNDVAEVIDEVFNL